MGRFAFMILLITNLLVCPLRCFAGQAGVAADKDCRQSACCCCRNVPEDNESSNDKPSPEDDCSCPNCICEGATIQADSEIPEADSIVAFGAWVVPADELLLKGASSSRDATRHQPQCFHRGRDALVAHELWLI